MKRTLTSQALLLIAFSSLAAAANLVHIRDEAPDNGPHFNGLVVNNAGTLNGVSTSAGLFGLETSFNGISGNYFGLLTYSADPTRPFSVGPVNGNGSAFDQVSMYQFAFTANTAEAIEKLWGNAYYETYASATKAAAFQFLLWEYASDATFDLDSGFTAITDTDVRAQAEAWHNQLGSWTTRAHLLVLDGTAENKQSFFLQEQGMFVNPMNAPETIENPEPSTYVLLGAGLIGMAVIRRRR